MEKPSQDRVAIEEEPWRATWVLAVVVFFAALGLLEFGWRQAGHRASVVDDRALWSQVRASVYGEDCVVALLGTSRMQLDTDVSALEGALEGCRVVQLSVSGRHPLAALRDLASDEAFRGLVVVGLTARAFLPEDRFGQQEYVEHFRREWGLPERAERTTATWVQESLVSAQATTNVLERLRRRLDGQPPAEPAHTVMNRDRSVAADYGRSDLRRIRARRIRAVRSFYDAAPLPDPGAWLELTRITHPWVEAIQSRGGRVLFLRPPTTDETWKMDEIAFPRSGFWDRFAAETGAEALHFRDVPEMRDLGCPDTSHLDASDAPAFSRALADQIRARGLIEERNG